ncbi:hypothetical protein ACFV9D_15870 [Streptomyces sp. NPDC059875]|uniref:hypothetical protein n=1 Tax=unclassified Streptomyces TaxID=2593676 RepID=UPI00366924DC
MQRWTVRRAATATSAVLGALALGGCSSTPEAEVGKTLDVEVAKGYSADVTVLAVEAGSAQDLSELKDASKYAGRTPYYLRYRYTKTQEGAADWSGEFAVSGEDGHLTRLSVLPSLDATGDADDPFDVRTFDKCRSVTGFDELPKGGSAEGCQIYLSDTGGGAPEKVEWVDGDETLATWK